MKIGDTGITHGDLCFGKKTLSKPSMSRSSMIADTLFVLFTIVSSAQSTSVPRCPREIASRNHTLPDPRSDNKICRFSSTLFGPPYPFVPYPWI